MKSVAVFVHLGKSPVKHLWLNLQRHLKLFPDIEPFVVLDELVHLKQLPTGVKHYVFRRENAFLNEDSFNAHDQRFRRGFWRFSLERLFALEEFHREYPDFRILHIESDVLLLPNFPWKQLELVDQVLWNNYNVDRDVSALLFIPSYDLHCKFLDDIQHELKRDPKHTDMTVLAAVRDSYESNYSLFPSLSRSQMELKSVLNSSPEQLIAKISDTEFFKGGIFDGAPIGMWLAGHDPRNNYGRALIHDPSPLSSGDSIIDPRNVEYEMDAEGNVFLKSAQGGEKLALWNLHIHSKSLKLFSENWIHELGRLVSLTENPKEIPFFSNAALGEMLIQSLKGGTFFRFLLGLPLIHKIRKWLSPLKRYILSKIKIWPR